MSTIAVANQTGSNITIDFEPGEKELIKYFRYMDLKELSFFNMRHNFGLYIFDIDDARSASKNAYGVNHDFSTYKLLKYGNDTKILEVLEKNQQHILKKEHLRKVVGNEKYYRIICNHIMLKLHEKGIDTGYVSVETVEYFRKMTLEEFRTIGYRSVVLSKNIHDLNRWLHMRPDDIYNSLMLNKNNIMIEDDFDMFLTHDAKTILLDYIKGQFIYELGQSIPGYDRSEIIAYLRKMTREEFDKIGIGVTVTNPDIPTRVKNQIDLLYFSRLHP